MTLEHLIEQYGLTEQAAAFAKACYETNSLAELDTPHAPADADDSDCADWGITPEEWSQALEVALQAKQASG